MAIGCSIGALIRIDQRITPIEVAGGVACHPPHKAQATPCTAKQSQSGTKSLICRGGVACARPSGLGHAAGANAHCLGVAYLVRPSIRASFDGRIGLFTGQAASECSKAITDLSRFWLAVPQMERFAITRLVLCQG